MSADGPITEHGALLIEALREMSDAELRDAADRIRGTTKRGARRRLTEAEATALAAIYDEQRERTVTTTLCERTVTS